MSLWRVDNPIFRANAFFPRPVKPGPPRPGVVDGTIQVDAETVLGYRLFAAQTPTPVILCFHGNGELACQYDEIAAYYRQTVGAALLVIDFRGYGWSTGTPTFRTLLSDTDMILKALPGVLKAAGVDSAECPLYVMGRSIGSAPAIHLAHRHPGAFRGLIIESGFDTLFAALHSAGFPLKWLARLGDGIGNRRKLSSLTLPLLVIHGEQDMLLPIEQGRQLFKASAAVDKTFVSIPGAGHNTVLTANPALYFSAIAVFVTRTST